MSHKPNVKPDVKPEIKYYTVYLVYIYQQDGTLKPYSEYAHYTLASKMCDALEDAGAECEIIKEVYPLKATEIH